MQTSTMWLIMIVFGGSLAVVANLQYARARDAEKKEAAARQVRALLQPELERNSLLLEEMLILESTVVSLNNFDTTAWQTVSGSDLLLGLPDSELLQILHIYHLMNRANDRHTRFVEAAVGIASTIQGSERTRQHFHASLQGILRELQPILANAISAGNGHKPSMQPLPVADDHR